MAQADNLEPEPAAQSSALDSLPSLLLFNNDVLVVTQTTIEESVPCPLAWASRALGRFFRRPCCEDLQEHAKAQHMLNHMKAVAGSLRALLPALLRPKPVDVRDIAAQWLQREAKQRADAPKPAEQQPADGLGAV